MVLARALAAANPSRGYRFRFRAGLHHLRRDWREVLGLSRGKRAQARFQDSKRARGSRGVTNFVAASFSSLAGNVTNEIGKREHSNVDAQESEVPKADARPAHRQRPARRRFGFRRIRLESPRSSLDHPAATRRLAPRSDAT